jgi:hypothetical protein
MSLEMTFATLHRVLMLGVHLLDTADAYTCGLHRESGAFRAACAAQLVAVAMDRRPSRVPAKEPIELKLNTPVEMRRRDRLIMAGFIRHVSNRAVTQPERDPTP